MDEEAHDESKLLPTPILPAEPDANKTNCGEANTAMKTTKEIEVAHMQPMTALIYDTDGTNTVTVKDVREMLNSAAKALTPLQQYLQEAKALVQKFKTKEKKESH